MFIYSLSNLWIKEQHLETFSLLSMLAPLKRSVRPQLLCLQQPTCYTTETFELYIARPQSLTKSVLAEGIVYSVCRPVRLKTSSTVILIFQLVFKIL